jgi:hypothetical protein
MLDILIQVNEGNAKCFTLNLKGPFEGSYGVYMHYMHHLRIFAFILKLGRVLHNPTKT